MMPQSESGQYAIDSMALRSLSPIRVRALWDGRARTICTESRMPNEGFRINYLRGSAGLSCIKIGPANPQTFQELLQSYYSCRF
jgi:hypothetical protein